MAYVITEACQGMKDRSCIEVCPLDCIGPLDEDADTPQLYIDPASCIDCGACMPACPVDAIFYEPKVPDNLRDYIRINAEHFETA